MRRLVSLKTSNRLKPTAWKIGRGGGVAHSTPTPEPILMPTSQLFTFPDPVNEVSARLVAAGVVTMSVAAIALDLRWLVAVIAYGFVARVLTGPTLSPLGQLVTRVLTPMLDRPAKLVALAPVHRPVGPSGPHAGRRDPAAVRAVRPLRRRGVRAKEFDRKVDARDRRRIDERDAQRSCC